MIFTVFLVLHVFTAVTMALVATLLLLGVWRDRTASIHAHVRMLSWGLAFELVSGSILALLSTSSVSFVSFCQNIALYLFATLGVLAIAYVRTRQPFLRGAVLVPVLPAVFLSSFTALSLL